MFVTVDALVFCAYIVYTDYAVFRKVVHANSVTVTLLHFKTIVLLHVFNFIKKLEI